MKFVLNITVACLFFMVAAPIVHAEKVEDFLKRTGVGNATANDLHENFQISVFVGGQTLKMNRDEIVKFWEQQKTSGIKLVVNSFTVVSKTETPDDDGKGGVISVVARADVSEDVRGSIVRIESTSHFIVLRDANGALRLLYVAVPKQVRHA